METLFDTCVRLTWGYTICLSKVDIPCHYENAQLFHLFTANIVPDEEPKSHCSIQVFDDLRSKNFNRGSSTCCIPSVDEEGVAVLVEEGAT